MNGVIGVADLLLDTALSEEQRMLAETIRSCSEGLLQILSDILDLSKIESDKMELEATQLDARQHLMSSLALFRTAVQDKGLQLNVRVAPDVPHAVTADAVRLRQVLLNLVSNALKFTHHGRISVSLSRLRPCPGCCCCSPSPGHSHASAAPSLEETQRREGVAAPGVENEGRVKEGENTSKEEGKGGEEGVQEAGKEGENTSKEEGKGGEEGVQEAGKEVGACRVVLQYTVADSGIGISQEGQSRLFQAFTQADSSTCRRFGGTGLGLAICRALVTLMGGTIELTSKEGEGSTFTFTVCVGALKDSPGQTSTAAEPVEYLHRISGGSHGGEAETQGMLLGRSSAQKDMLPVLESTRRSPGFETVTLAGEEGGEARGLRFSLSSEVTFESTQKSAGEDGGEARGVRFSLSSVVVPAGAVEDEGTEGCMDGRQDGRQDAGLHVAPGDRAAGLPRRRGMRGSFSEGDIMLMEERFDLVLMDCHMPEMDGLEATRRIRRMETERTREQLAGRSTDACTETGVATTEAMPPQQSMANNGSETGEAVVETVGETVESSMTSGSGAGSGRNGVIAAPMFIVALTASAFDFEREACFSAGMNHFLTKPIRPKDLQGLIKLLQVP
ncbi:unnamed protein product [Closterium sp. Yama58-4]|nr:unnamed protein product [Closterium sp. Yama58-4]